MASLSSNQELHSKALMTLLEDQGGGKKKKGKTDSLNPFHEAPHESDSDEEETLKPAAGFAKMDLLRHEKDHRAGVLLGRILERGAVALDTDRKSFRFREFAKREVCARGHKTYATILWLVGGALDTLVAALQGPISGKEEFGKIVKGVTELALVYLAICQVVLDDGSWKNGFPMTLSTEAPWGTVDRSGETSTGDNTNFCQLTPQHIVSTIRSFREDIKALADVSVRKEEPKAPKKR